MKDLTKDFEYERLIREEMEHYAQIEVTDDLKEGGVHASSAWHHYWDRVKPVIQGSGFGNMGAYLSQAFSHLERPIEVLSLGSGYCGHELGLARTIAHSHRIHCTDINEDLFGQAKAVVRDEGLSVDFSAADINFLALEPQRYDLVFAHAVIHHVINLEHLFEQLAGCLAPGGLLHLVDVVGKNRKLIWDENERFANALLELLPSRITRGLRLAVSEADNGMEGIRQQEIIPHLRKTFTPLFEHRHGAFMRFICTNPELGAAFDPRDSEARHCLDFLIDCDDSSVRHGLLRPLELWGVYRVAAPTG